MGIIVPRPAMRSKERRAINEHLRRHGELMKQYLADGLSRTEASAKAYEDLTGRKSAVN